ncbi:MAG: carboxypeptidase regulatory-like domain-containing protein [Acidobacteriota bacterium]
MHYPALALTAFLAGSAMAFGAADVGGTVEGTVTGIEDLDSVIVYVEGVTADSLAEGKYELDQVNKTFIPFVLPVPVGAQVVFRNSEDLLHNVHAYLGKKTVFNWGMPIKGMELRHRFQEVGDVMVLCDKHAEMEAWIKILPNSHFVKADQNGSYVLENVPPGRYGVAAWHPHAKLQTKMVEIPATGSVRVDFQIRK